MPSRDSHSDDSGRIISPRSTRARQAADRIRDELVRRFTPGDRLPGERVLAKMLSVSRETVRKALAELDGEGWIKNVSGQGRLVSRPRRRPVRTTGLFFPFDAEFLLVSRFNREVYSGLSAVAVEQRRHVLNFYGLCRGYRDLDPSVFWSPGMRAVDSLMTLEVFRTELSAIREELDEIIRMIQEALSGDQAAT